MSLLFVPVYIKYLGIEAYGLIGVFAMLQGWLSLLDMGMKPALGREMGRYTGGAHNEQSIWDLLRSIEIISIVIAVLVGLIIWAASGWLATDWVKAKSIPTNVSAQAFALMGFVSALQFVESLYSSTLTGLQRQVLQNGVLSIMATVRGLGAVCVLVYVSQTIQAFFIWQCIISVTSLLFSGVIVYKILPSPPCSARFSLRALKDVWRFAAGIVGISLLSLLLMQVDKILLSRILSLEAFGYYSLAGVVSGALYMLLSPVTAVYYPRFNELLARNEDEALVKLYHQASQIVTVIVGSAAVVLITFAEQILFLWTSNLTLTMQVAPIMAVLALGSFMHCLMFIPYQIQLAYGWTLLSIRINTVAVVILVPLLLWFVPIYGAIAAAWIWVSLNLWYLLIGTQFMYRRILKKEKWMWYRNDVGIPLLTASITAVLFRFIFPSLFTRLYGSLLIITLSIVVLGVSVMAAPLLRQIALNYLFGAIESIRLKIKIFKRGANI